MLLRTGTAVLVVAAAAATWGAALACKGPTLILSDDFKPADPAWVGWGAVKLRLPGKP